MGASAICCRGSQLSGAHTGLSRLPFRRNLFSHRASPKGRRASARSRLRPPTDVTPQAVGALLVIGARAWGHARRHHRHVLDVGVSLCDRCRTLVPLLGGLLHLSHRNEQAARSRQPGRFVISALPLHVAHFSSSLRPRAEPEPEGSGCALARAGEGNGQANRSLPSALDSICPKSRPVSRPLPSPGLSTARPNLISFSNNPLAFFL
jgi:hypothetical protein